MASDTPTGIALPDFTRGIEKLAGEILTAQLGEQHGKQAVARLMTAMRTAARRSPDILRCTPASVAECLAMCIMTEMLPGGAQPPVYLLPRNNKAKVKDPNTGNVREVWQMELQFQLSFRGMRMLARRAGMYPSTTLVYEGDTVIRETLEVGADGASRWVPDETPIGVLVGGWELGPMERLRFCPGPGDRALKTLRGAFVSTTRRVGTALSYEGTTVLGRDTIEKRRQNSDAVKKGWNSPWTGWDEEMVFKTCIRYWAARSAEFDDVGRRAFEMHDQSENIIDTTATVIPRESATARLDRALGLDADPVDYAEEQKRTNDREAVPTAALPAHIATLTAAGLAWDEVCDWFRETQGQNPNEWPDADKAAFASDVAANPANFKASPFYTGGGK